jgi:nucleoside recognition membrane protein YjiH
MTSSRTQDKVNSNDESKSISEIISEGRKQFKVENECGTERVNFQIHIDTNVSDTFAASL